MKKLSVTIALGLCFAFGLARCGAGTDVCSKAANANLLTKAGNCNFGVDGGTDAGFSLNFSPGLLKACQTGIAGCSDADKTEITTSLDCLGNLQPCVAGNEKAFESSIITCAVFSAGISQACQTSLANAADGGF